MHSSSLTPTHDALVKPPSRASCAPPSVPARSRAILRYIASLPGGNEIYGGSDLKARATIENWLEVESGYYNSPVSGIVAERLFKKMRGAEPDEAVVAEKIEAWKKVRGAQPASSGHVANPLSRSRVGRASAAEHPPRTTDAARGPPHTCVACAQVLDVYEKRLATQPYLAGSEVTIADLSHIPYTAYALDVGAGSVLDSYPNVKAWWERITSRPSWAKVSALRFGA